MRFSARSVWRDDAIHFALPFSVTCFVCALLVANCPQAVLAVSWDGGAGAGDTSWYNPINWNGNTLPDQLTTSLNNAATAITFDPLHTDASAYTGYTGSSPLISSYSVNDPLQPNGITLSGGPRYLTLPYPSPNTNYAAPNAYVNPPNTTYITGRVSVNNSTLNVNSGYMYVAQYDPTNQTPAAIGPYYAGTPGSASGQVPSRIDVGTATGTASTIIQSGGTVDARYGNLRIASGSGTSDAAGVTGVYDFRGGYLVAGTHTANNGNAQAGSGGPRSGGGTPENSDYLGFRLGGGVSNNAANAANAAHFITRYDQSGVVWTQSMIANSSSNAKSSVTFEFHYGARTDNASDRGVTPIFVENTYKFNNEKTSPSSPASRTDDRGVYLDFKLDSPAELVQVSPGVYRPEDIPLIRLHSTVSPNGNNGQIFSGVPANGLMGSGTLSSKGYTPFRLDAMGSTGAISLLTENSASSLITRTYGNYTYTWQLSYFGNIDNSGIVSRTFNSWNNNDIVLLGVSATATPSLPLAGDYNNDGSVNSADYVVWLKSFGQSIANGQGADGNNNGTIDNADYTTWRQNFGNPSGPGSGSIQSAQVPEPTVTLMLVAGIFGVVGLQRGNRATR